MGDEVEVREVSSLEEAREAGALMDRVWNVQRVVTGELLRAMSSHGNPVLAAYLGERMVGAQMGFLAPADDGLSVHSHVTGVLPEVQHRGVGFRLKLAQRDWCLARGIRLVTWTFDPMMARNAYFNLRKLGGAAVRFHRDYYGPMTDAINAGERTDRLEIRWELEDPRVAAAVEGRGEAPDAGGATPLLEEAEGAPRPHPGAAGERLLVRVPSDYVGLREADREAARAWRDAVAAALEDSLARGYRATGFLRGGAYLLERT